MIFKSMHVWLEGATTWLLLGSVLLLAGCDGSIAQVAGTVTLDGEPLDHGSVLFHRPGEPQGIGKIQTDGSYTVKVGTEEGLQPGKYQVTVFAMTPQSDASGFGDPVHVLTTPVKYKSAATSGLDVTLEPGRNTYDVALASQGD